MGEFKKLKIEFACDFEKRWIEIEKKNEIG